MKEESNIVAVFICRKFLLLFQCFFGICLFVLWLFVYWFYSVLQNTSHHLFNLLREMLFKHCYGMLLSRSTTRLRCWSTRGVSCCCSPAVSAPWARRGKSASRWASVSHWLKRESSVLDLPSSACSTSRNICGVWGSTGMSTLPWRSLFFLRLVSNSLQVLLSS